MKKVLLIVGGILVVLLICGGVAAALIGRYFFANINNLTSNIADSNNSDTSAPNGSNNGTAIRLDVCTLFTEAEAKDLLKTDVVTNTSNGSDSCSYSTKDVQKFGIITFSISRSTDVTANAAFESILTTTYKDKLTQVSGFKADKAYIAKDYSVFIALKGNAFIVISGASTEYQNNNKGLLTPVATKVLNRL